MSDAQPCTCPLIRIGTRTPDPDGPRNLSPACPIHGARARREEDDLFRRRVRRTKETDRG